MPAATGTAAPRVTRGGGQPIGILPAASFLLVGLTLFMAVFIHVTAVQQGPNGSFAQLTALTPLQMRQHVLGNVQLGSLGDKIKAKWNIGNVLTAQHTLGLDPATPLAKVFDGFSNLLFTLITFFVDYILPTRTGRGLLFLLLSALIPLASFMTIEPLKPTRSAFFGIGIVILTLLIGQVVCVGAATPAIYIPYYIVMRIVEAKGNPTGVFPLAPPTSSALKLSSFLGALTILSTVSLVVIPNTSRFFFPAQVTFQLFPLLYIPLLFVKAPTGTTQKPGKTTVIRANRALASHYSNLSYVALLFHVIALYHLYPILPNLFQALVQFAKQSPEAFYNSLEDLTVPHGQRSAKLAALAASPAHKTELEKLVQRLAAAVPIANDGEWLLIFDFVGVVFSSYAIILADWIVDGWMASGEALAGATEAGKKKAERTKRRMKRVHDDRNIFADIIMGLPVVFALGPGFGMAKYLQRRETLAEKARFEEAGAVGQRKRSEEERERGDMQEGKRTIGSKMSLC